MKKLTVTVLSIILLGTGMLQTGCFGRFQLVRNIYEFHDSIAGDDLGGKFIKTILYWIPGGIVYGIAGLIDSVVLNLIEFWTGSNPLAMNEGDVEMQIVKKGGEKYKITATKNKFNVKQLTGEEAGREANLVYNPENLSWNVEANDQSFMVAQYIKDKATKEVNVRFYGATGTTYDVPFSEEGLAMAHEYKPDFEEVATLN